MPAASGIRTAARSTQDRRTPSRPTSSPQQDPRSRSTVHRANAPRRSLRKEPPQPTATGQPPSSHSGAFDIAILARFAPHSPSPSNSKVEAAYRRAREQPRPPPRVRHHSTLPDTQSRASHPSRRREKQPQPSEATRWGRARAAGPTGAAQSPMDRHSFAMRPTTSQRQRLQQ